LQTGVCGGLLPKKQYETIAVIRGICTVFGRCGNPVPIRSRNANSPSCRRSCEADRTSSGHGDSRRRRLYIHMPPFMEKVSIICQDLTESIVQMAAGEVSDRY